jgi:hypothetical protein
MIAATDRPAAGIAVLCDGQGAILGVVRDGLGGPAGGSVFVVTLPERGLEGAWPRS